MIGSPEPVTAADARLEVRILGPTEVLRGGVPVELPRGRSRGLLALLALEAARTVSTERLIRELWGSSPPATVVTVLHGLVSGLRRCIEPGRAPDAPPELLRTRPPGYTLDIAPDRVDVHRFRALVGRARAAPPAERAGFLRTALRCWRGPALADAELLGTTSGEATALEELRLAAHEDLFDAELSLGRHRDIAAEIELLVAAHPLRERLYGQLMLAHYRAGRQSDALAVWHRARATLVEDVGVEPGPGLRRLHQAVLQHDPALELGADRPDGAAAGPSGRQLAARAGELLAAAGSRVFDRHWDAATAEELFSQAEALLPHDHPRRLDVTDRIPETYLMLGRHRDADARLTRSLAEAREQGDVRRESFLRLERARIQLIVGPDPLPLADIAATAAAALARAEEADEAAAISAASYVLTLVDLRLGRIGRMEEMARRGSAAAERSGAVRERLASRWMLALALAEGPTPIEDAVAECRQLAELGTSQHAGVLSELARLHALHGDDGSARRHVTLARRQLERRPGMRRPAMFISQRSAEVELLAGRPDRAEPYLRTALSIADDLGEADQRAQLAAQLAVVVASRGRSDEARELAHASQSAAPRRSLAAQVLWRAAMAAAETSAGRASADARGLLDEATRLVPAEMRMLAAELRSLRP